MKNLSKRDQIILYALGAIVLLFLYYQFFLYPYTEKISAVKTSIEEKTVRADEIKQMENENRKIQKKIVELKEQYEVSKKSIPIDIRDPEIEHDLYTMASEKNINLKTLSFGGESEFVIDKASGNSSGGAQKGSLMSIPVTMNFSGDPLSVWLYIDAVENTERIAEVKNVSFTKGAEAVEVSMITQFYFIKGDKEDKKELQYDFAKPSEGKSNLFH